MSYGYQISDPRACYFLTLQVVDWLDVFTRLEYRNIVIDSLKYCREHKSLKVYAYVVMSNHVHLIAQVPGGNLSDVIRDSKKHTAKQMLAQAQIPTESRSWLKDRFAFYANMKGQGKAHQIWTHENHAIVCDTERVFFESMHYIHQNPVRAGWVDREEDYLYSSARCFRDRPFVMDVDPF